MTATTTAPPNDAIKRLLPWLVAVAFFMQSLDTTILNTAVPAIARAMDVTPLSVKSVLASYTLSLAVFIPVSGWMADRFGTRRVFASAIGLFTLGSVLCGLSTSIEMLVACRILQGAGGAMMMPVGRMTLARTYDKADLVRVMSFVAIPSLIGPMVGPVAGGLIVTYLDWRGVFFVNVPVGLLGVYFVYRHLPDYREQQTHPLDVVGLVLFGGGIALLSYVLEVFGEHSLSGAEMLGLLALAAVLLAGYGIRATLTAFPAAGSRAVQDPHLPRGGERRLLHASRTGRHPVPVPAALPDRPRLLADPVGPAGAAAGHRLDRAEDLHAGDPGAAGLPQRAGRQHDRRRPDDHVVRDRGRAYADLADRRAGLRPRFLHLACSTPA